MDDKQAMDPLEPFIVVEAEAPKEATAAATATFASGTADVNNIESNSDKDDIIKSDGMPPSTQEDTDILVEATDDDNDNEDHYENPHFPHGSRGAVDGAAAAFFTAGFLLAGPLVGLITAAGAAHLAANKEGCIPNFVRHCGELLDGVGKNSRHKNRHGTRNSTTSSNTNDASVDTTTATLHENEKFQSTAPTHRGNENDETARAIAVLRDGVAAKKEKKAKRQPLWSRLTDELVNGAQWVEERLFRSR